MVTLDTLALKVEGSAGDAARSVKNLGDSLVYVAECARQIQNLNGVSRILNAIGRAVRGFGAFSDLENGLDSATRAVKKIQTLRSELAKVSFLGKPGTVGEEAKGLKNRYFSSISQSEIRKTMVELRQRMANNPNDEKLVEDIQNFANRLTGSYAGKEGYEKFDMLKSAAGKYTLSAAQMQELKYLGHTISSANSILRGTGIKLSAGEGTLTSDWEQLSKHIPSLRDVKEEGNQIRELLKFAKSARDLIDEAKARYDTPEERGNAFVDVFETLNRIPVEDTNQVVVSMGEVATEIRDLADALGELKSVSDAAAVIGEVYAAVGKGMAVRSRSGGSGRKAAPSVMPEIDMFDMGNRNVHPTYMGPGEGTGGATFYNPLTGEFESVAATIDRMNREMGSFYQLTKNTAWAAGDMADQFGRVFSAWNTMRMGSALGAGAAPALEAGQTGWTYWKDGAIEVEGTVSDAFDSVGRRIEGTTQLLLGAGEAAEKTAEDIASIYGTGSMGSIPNIINNIGRGTMLSDEEMMKLRPDWYRNPDVGFNYGKNNEYMMNQFNQRFDEILGREGAAEKIRNAVSWAAKDSGAIKKNIEDTVPATQKIRDGFRNVREAISKSFKSSLLGQFFRVAKMRALRAAVKAIASSFKEGITNLYQWSHLNKGHFAESMDTATTKLLLMKNSIATAFAPAIEALVPILSTMVNWIHEASNAISQFLALLSGRDSWTMATEHIQEFGETLGGQHGAGKAVKDLLADWDELNVIQSKSGGGGGSGFSPTDYQEMFEESFVFDQRIKDAVQWLKDNFDYILNIAKEIGTAILLWKLGGSISRMLGLFRDSHGYVTDIGQKIKQGFAGTILLAVGLTTSAEAGSDIAREGFTEQNLLELIVGELSSVAGGAFLGFAVGGAGGAAIGGIVGLGISVLVTLVSFEIENKEITRQWLLDNFEEFNAVDAVINVQNVEIQANQSAIEAARVKAAEIFGENFDVLPVGIDTEETRKRLNEQVNGEGGLISLLDEVIESNVSLVKKAFENGGIDEDTMLSSIAGWTGIQTALQDLGATIGGILTGSIKNEILDSGATLLDATMEVLREVNNAITGTQVQQSIKHTFEDAVGSGRKIGSVYADEYQNAYNSNMNLARQNYDNALAQFNAYQILAEHYPENEKYAAALEEARENLEAFKAAMDPKVVKDQTDNMMKEAVSILPELLGGLISGRLSTYYATNKSPFENAIVGSGNATNAVRYMEALLTSHVRDELGEDVFNAFTASGGTPLDFMTQEMIDWMNEIFEGNYGKLRGNHKFSDLLFGGLGLYNEYLRDSDDLSIEDLLEPYVDKDTEDISIKDLIEPYRDYDRDDYSITEILENSRDLDDEDFSILDILEPGQSISVDTSGHDISTEDTAKENQKQTNLRLASLERRMDAMNGYLREIASKEFSVGLYPSPAWSTHNRNSGRLGEMVSGEMYVME